MSVTVINDSNFLDTLNNSKVIVKYYADWCGSCKLFSPKFKRLSSDENYNDIKFAEINAEENELARKKGGVDNLPYIATFHNGELVEGTATSKEEYVVQMINNLNAK